MLPNSKKQRLKLMLPPSSLRFELTDLCRFLFVRFSHAIQSQQSEIHNELQTYINKLNDFKVCFVFGWCSFAQFKKRFLQQRISERDDALVMGDAAAEALEKLQSKQKEVPDTRIQTVNDGSFNNEKFWLTLCLSHRPNKKQTKHVTNMLH